MGDRSKRIEVDGRRVRSGTSIYHTSLNRVLWIDRIIDGEVVISSRDRTDRISVEAFLTAVRSGAIKIEAAPPPTLHGR